MKRVDFAKLPTEQRNPLTRSLDTLPVETVLRLMNRQDVAIPRAVARESASIAAAVRLIVKALRSGGRMFFAGAGTSGRLGVLESAELPPTFNTPPRLAQALMAGGRRAVFRSQEGAEDNAERARAEVRKRARKGDVMIGIAASGVTPFAQAAVDAAKKKGAATILLTCNPAISRRLADAVIALDVGPEIIAGSTRLKSGTATKMVLNMLTAAAMVQIGKVYGDRMVDLQPRSRKLRERGLRLVRELTGLSSAAAEKIFARSGGHVKTAVVMAKKGWDRKRARAWLSRHGGLLGPALK